MSKPSKEEMLKAWSDCYATYSIHLYGAPQYGRLYHAIYDLIEQYGPSGGSKVSADKPLAEAFPPGHLAPACWPAEVWEIDPDAPPPTDLDYGPTMRLKVAQTAEASQPAPAGRFSVAVGYLLKGYKAAHGPAGPPKDPELKTALYDAARFLEQAGQDAPSDGEVEEAFQTIRNALDLQENFAPSYEEQDKALAVLRRAVRGAK